MVSPSSEPVPSAWYNYSTGDEPAVSAISSGWVLQDEKHVGSGEVHDMTDMNVPGYVVVTGSFQK